MRVKYRKLKKLIAKERSRTNFVTPKSLLRFV